jgi:hypothetical protein
MRLPHNAAFFRANIPRANDSGFWACRTSPYRVIRVECLQRCTPQRESSFASTRWTVVHQAADSQTASQHALSALSELCQIYWRPVYVFLRRQGIPQEAAEDLTQGFFADLIESRVYTRAEPTKGRFRLFLLGTLNISWRTRAITTMRKSAAAAACRSSWMTRRFLKPKRTHRAAITGAQMAYSSGNGHHHLLGRRSIGLHKNTSLAAKARCLKR